MDLLQKNIPQINANASKIIKLVPKIQEMSKKLKYNGLETEGKFDDVLP